LQVQTTLFTTTAIALIVVTALTLALSFGIASRDWLISGNDLVAKLRSDE
jgi:hypothetical protein